MEVLKFLLSPLASKQLEKLPYHIQRKFEYWQDMLKTVGLMKGRKYKGFHDEPLKGTRKWQRSVRLSKGYRVIYEELSHVKIYVLEVTKHDY